ncbi:hypothetical protein ACN9MZ_26110 [Pseudoduganella sp. S-14]|uniref:AbiTii domain-containing protein n=1 Tax=Pseudoduganella sp. S-14 TaxID=3404065 RepID=UPI003CEFB62C
MAAIVPELVNMATDPTVSTTDLLRKALVVARRLAVPELIEWIDGELNGYKDSNIPAYRSLRGQLMALNPINGPIPLMMPTAESSEHMTLTKARQSIPELAQLAQSRQGVFSFFSAEIEHRLMRGMGVPMRPVISLSTVQIHGIVEKVRSRILEWALDLEGRGILGEGMTFTLQEKQMVQQMHYHFGDVNGSQIQIGSNSSTQNQAQAVDIDALKALIEVLRGAIDRNEVAGEAGDELQAELATLQAQAASPKPKWQVIKATASSIKSVLENGAGGILAAQALPYLAPFLG